MSEDDLRRLAELTAAHLGAETRRHFDTVAERLENKIAALGESVSLLDQKLERKASGLEERVERTAAETQAMIRFSHAELDRRWPLSRKAIERCATKLPI